MCSTKGARAVSTLVAWVNRLRERHAVVIGDPPRFDSLLQEFSGSLSGASRALEDLEIE